jgi:putative hydrolase of the HAD superfamily
MYRAIRETSAWYWSDPERHRRGRLDLDATRRTMVGLAFEKLGLDNADLAGDIAAAYALHREEAVHPFPGAIETLQALVDRGVSLALLTNGEAAKQRAKVDRFGLDRFFRTVLVEGELGYGKPDERVYRRAMSDLGLGPADVWAVGDHLEWEVAAPQALGVFGIWNDFRRHGLPDGATIVPDRIIHSISELIA